ncbi:MAG: argininosuccinate lyase [Endomicrobia bacterium]|nr:argininosuccinate lyase [Endomicrobiia bacterium]
MKDKLLEEFISSFNYDNRLAKYEIDTCIVWTQLLARKKIVDSKKAKKVIQQLKKLKKNIKDKLVPAEDVHYAVEQTIEKMLGKDKELAGIIRTARSRNDLVVSDERLMIKDEIKEIIGYLKQVISSIIELANKNLDVAMVGYTHLQPAQPVLFSHYILSYAWWFVRDIGRFRNCQMRVDVSVLGSAAFAGSSFNIDRFYVAKKLGFTNLSMNSVDAVSDRDFIVEFISCCAITMMHLSRIAEDFILWCNPNFGYIKLPKKLTSGSSIMPQKQNPDYLELIRGKTAKVYSAVVGILVLMKALPLSYNRDMQEDKVYLNLAVDTLKDSLQVVNKIFCNIEINKERLEDDLRNYDFVLATEIANFFVRYLGFNFKKAHKKVQLLLEYCWRSNKKISELLSEEYYKIAGIKISEKLFSELKNIINPQKIAANYKTYGGSSIKEVKRQIRELKLFLDKS